MMQARAILKGADVSAQKARLVANLIRRLPVEQALNHLAFCRKRVAPMISKLLNSAIANAEHNHGIDIDELFISDIRVDGAKVLKRMRARAKGRGNRILKRSSHITICVSDEKPGKDHAKQHKDNKGK